VRKRATKVLEAKKNAPLGRALARAAGSLILGRSQTRSITRYEVTSAALEP